MLTGGLVVLAICLGVAWVVSTRSGSIGPAPGFVVWHGLAAAAAVGLQLRADRRRGRRAGGAHAGGRDGGGRDVGGTVAAAAVLGLSALVLALWLA